MRRLALKFVFLNCFIWALLLSVASCGGGGGTAWFPSCSLSFITPNYIAVVDQSTGLMNLPRWWKGFPIKIWFDTPLVFGTSQGNVSTTTVILEGINRWPTATGNGVSYTIVTNESEAHVKIHVDFLGAEPGTLAVTTASTFQISREVIAADILFHTWQGITDAQFLNGLKATAAHEMGHVLFIKGHSNDTADLMYSSNDSRFDKAISGTDVNTIRTVYCDDYQTRGRSREVGSPDKGPLVLEKTECPVVQN